MANISISGLPEQTGKTDNDVLAIVDSGETTTSKIKVSTLLAGVGGGEFVPGQATDSIQPDYYSPTAIGTTNYNDKAFLGGGYSNTINTTLTSGNIGAKTIVGGRNNSLNYYSQEAAIFGGRNNQENSQGGFDPSASVIVGGASNLSNFWQSNMFGTTSSDNLAYYYNVMVGGFNNNITFGNKDTSSIIGGKNNDITGGSTGTILGGTDGTYSSGSFSVIVGGNTNTMNNNRSVILGGSGLSSNYDDEVQVPNLTIANYASLNFPDDATAAANGIILGQVYHNAGALRVRIV